LSVKVVWTIITVRYPWHNNIYIHVCQI